MKKTLLMTTLVTAFMFTVAPAMADDMKYKSETTISKDEDGDSKSIVKTSETDAAGTTTKNEASVKVDQDDDGDYKKTTKTMSKKDPKGLFNTEKSTSKEVIEKKGSHVTKETTKKVNGDTIVDTKIETDVAQ